MNDNKSGPDVVRGYEIKRSVLFENDRGFALGENPNAVNPFVTWQFTEENGVRDYYWGHYKNDLETATKDYEFRISDYQRSYGIMEKEVYKYYSTQRPVDIGTFPKTANGPIRIFNYAGRENVESGSIKAWGFLVYDAPLTEKQIAEYELRAAPDNPDISKIEKIADGRKKSIAEQLKDGAEQVANDNAARPAPVKKTDRDR